MTALPASVSGSAHRSNVGKEGILIITHRGRFESACWPTYLTIGRPVVRNSLQATSLASPEVPYIRAVDVHGHLPRRSSASKTGE